jgi:hypothetical protein
MTALENEIQRRGFGPVLEEISTLAAGARQHQLGQVGGEDSDGLSVFNTLLARCNDATCAGHEVDAALPRVAGQDR